MGMKTYKIINETSFDTRTQDEVIGVLETARLNRTRLHISLGDSASGRDWLEECETYGYVGRSLGPTKVPLMIANSRSLGGGAILDHCIVRIRESAGGQVLYQHPKYHHGQLEIRRKTEPVELSNGRILTVDVLRDGQMQAAFENFESARRWAQKLGIGVRVAV
jgi:hypothetical protein